MKKRLFTLCALMMAIVMTFGACGSSTKETQDTTDTSDAGSTTDTGKTEEATTAPSEDSAEAEEITVMIWDRGTAAPGSTNEDNVLTQWIQEQVLAACNVKVNYMAVPRSGSDDKLNVMMAGGTAPDIVFTYDANIFGNYAANGGLTDLTEAYANNGSTISSTIGEIQYMGMYEDKQYAIMKRRGTQMPRHVAYIRKDWLDALGMAVPTNQEELIAALRAFKEKNPGNVENVIPWAMGGNPDTEKFYLNFVGSYVSKMSERDSYLYSESYKALANGAVEGFRVMNQLYNEGLINKDFATDTTAELFNQNVSAGNVGFLLADSTQIWSLMETLETNVPGAEFVAVNPFASPEGEYINPTEPLYGMYIMVPATSSEKVNACVKYLNWLADPENAENVAYGPDHERNAAGVPIYPTAEHITEKAYPGNFGDYNIVTDHFAYTDSKDGVVSQWAESNTAWAETDWFSNFYDVIKLNQFTYPTYPVVLESETTYGSNLRTAAIAYAYTLITCDSAKFDETQKAEYDKLVAAGLQTVLDERAAYYDANVAK